MLRELMEAESDKPVAISAGESWRQATVEKWKKLLQNKDQRSHHISAT
jgi:hypothetical protein